MKLIKLALIATIGLSILSSCSEKDKGNHENNDGTTVVKVKTMSYEGDGVSLDGENKINDMKACLFKDGVMTRIFENISSSDSRYEFKLENMDGRLYMLANLDSMIDLGSMLHDNITEDEFVKTTIDNGIDGNIVNFFTAAVDLVSTGKYSYTADLIRGFARFDLAVSSNVQEISVKSIEITNLVQKSFLMTPSTGIASPDNAGNVDKVIDFTVPVTGKRQGFLYVYEQKNSGIQINVTVEIAGVEKVLTRSFDVDIERNNVYTLKVNKNDIDLYVNVNIADWETGPDTEIEA